MTIRKALVIASSGNLTDISSADILDPGSGVAPATPVVGSGNSITVKGGDANTLGNGGSLSLLGGNFVGAGNGGDVTVRGGSGSTNHGTIYIGDTTTKEVVLGPGTLGTRVDGDLFVGANVARTAPTGAGSGNSLTIKASNANTLGNGGSLSLLGGNFVAAGNGGDVTVRGGSGSLNHGTIYLGDSTTKEIVLGPGTLGTRVSGTLTIGTGNSLSLDGNLNGSDVNATNVTGTNLNTLTAGSTSDAAALHTHGGLGANMKVTADGGLAIYLKNSTVSTISKGRIVEPDSSNDDSIVLCPTSSAFPIGVVDADIAAGAKGWVVVAGIVDVYLDNVPPPNVARDWVVLVSTVNAGQGTAQSSVPSTVDHWREVGHTLRTSAANPAGLVKCVVHFN